MMNISAEEQQDIRNRSHKPMMYLAIVAMCMFFGGLTSAYIVSSGGPNWLRFELPQMFYTSTAIIVLSSLTMWWAYASAKKDNFTSISLGTSLTLLLGLAFVVCQILAWQALNEKGIFFGGSTSTQAGSFLFAIIYIGHLGHLAGGIIMLIYVCIKSFRKSYHSKNLLGLQLSSIYWHFLDLLWIYLFLFIYFTH